MIFSSNIFLFLFLPCIIIIYYFLKKAYRNIFLFLSSLLFYAWGEPKFVFIMLGSIMFNYIMALAISNVPTLGGKISKILLEITIAGNLSILFYYKYFNFFITNINRLGFQFATKDIVLPIGISFFTFQAMSYVIDVYRGIATVQIKPQNIGLYISFFPQLIAGPIVRYQTIADQIEGRQETFDHFSEGVKRFILGFSKKIILANNLALVADNAFGLSDVERSVLFAWLGALAYSLQILFDFSGYSDMAIGLGKMFGFRFLENFNYPYISKSISEFWRRWHISLGQWFRDYVYFPLGGSRVADSKHLVFNLFIVWLLTGVWHGASWNFIIWGFFYFILIAVEKLTGYPKRFKSVWYRIAYQIFTLLCVMMGWVMFRATGARAGLQYMLSMFGLKGNMLFCDNVIVAIRDYGFFFLAAILSSTPIFCWLRKAADKLYIHTVVEFVSAGGYLFLLLWSVSYIMIGSHNPFIYFNF